ncbi:MAG TPA: TonB-dependent receptor [Stenotrophomonas sp.]|nr:TonB-dependent receptor [Stenotrophomonas sp.]
MTYTPLPHPLCAALACALLLAAGDAAAQAPKATSLPAVNVQANAYDGRLQAPGAQPAAAIIDHDIAQPVSVIDRAELDRLSPISTLDVLARVPGASASQAGGIAGTLFLRGLNSNDMRVPMYIDGDRFRGRNTLQYMLISPTEIEQVEVIRGPTSARFGSDGMGGLVHFVTRRARGNLEQPFGLNGGELSMTYRSNGGGFQGNAALEAAGSGFDLRSYVTSRSSGNYSSGNGRIPNSDYRSRGGGIVLGYQFNPRHRVEASFRTARVEDGSASGLPPYPRSIPRRDPLAVNQWRLAYSGRPASSVINQVDASLYLNRFDTVQWIRNQPTPDRRVDIRNRVIGPWVYGGRVGARAGSETVGVAFGMDFMHERRPGSRSSQTVTTPSGSTASGYRQISPNQTQSNVGIYVDGHWMPAPRWTLNAGLRQDWFRSDVALSPLPSPALLDAFRRAQDTRVSAATGSVGLSYRASPLLELLASGGTSFRMPWSGEMFSSGPSATGYSLPNPGLKPERGRNIEAGMRLHAAAASAGLTAFRSDFSDFVERTNTWYLGVPAFQRRNVGRARVQGVEADWRWQVNAWVNTYGNISYLRGTNLSTGQPLISIMPLGGLLGVQYLGTAAAWSLKAEFQWAQGKKRVDPSREYPAAGYGVVNLWAEFQLDRLGLPALRNTQMVLGVSNVFDRTYRTAATISNVAFPLTDTNPLLAPGRSIDLTWRTRF